MENLVKRFCREEGILNTKFTYSLHLLTPPEALALIQEMIKSHVDTFIHFR